LRYALNKLWLFHCFSNLVTSLSNPCFAAFPNFATVLYNPKRSVKLWAVFREFAEVNPKWLEIDGVFNEETPAVLHNSLWLITRDKNQLLNILW
jgi:hypothetical protein